MSIYTYGSVRLLLDASRACAYMYLHTHGSVRLMLPPSGQSEKINVSKVYIIESASRSPPGHCRSCCSLDDLYWKLFARLLYEFEAFCRRGASFGRFFSFHFAPLGAFLEQFWTLGVIFEALCIVGVKKTLRRQRCPRNASKRPPCFRPHVLRIILDVMFSDFSIFCLKCCCKKHVIFQACFSCVFLAIWSNANQWNIAKTL